MSVEENKKAVLLLTRALERDVIDLSEDPLYPVLENYKWKMELIHKLCIVTPIAVVPYSLYRFSYLKGQPIFNRGVKGAFVLCLFSVADYCSPPRIDHSATFMRIALQRKDELQRLNNEHKLDLV
jgi:hypothetical protein